MPADAQPISQFSKLPLSLKPRQTQIIGKIESMREHGDKYYTVVICPAADEYSRPTTPPIASNSKLGKVGEMIDVICWVGGYSVKTDYVVKSTGEHVTRKHVVTLDLVE